MKDTHEMTRLELENEVVFLRKLVDDLQVQIAKKDYIIRVYGDSLDEQNNKKLTKERKGYINEKRLF
jgi:hypothetical protein